MAKIDAELLTRLKGSPDAVVQLIVRATDDPATVADQAQSLGIKVRRQYRLAKYMAVTGRANLCLKLLDEPGVASIEEDREVHTM